MYACVGVSHSADTYPIRYVRISVLSSLFILDTLCSCLGLIWCCIVFFFGCNSIVYRNIMLRLVSSKVFRCCIWGILFRVGVGILVVLRVHSLHIVV